MAAIELTELQNHRTQIVGDVRHLVEKYRKIFDWDVPDVDQKAADTLIIAEMRRALDAIGAELSGAATPTA